MKKIALRNGLLMLIGFIAFFLAMWMAGNSANIEFRMLNGVIHLTFIGLALYAYRSKRPDTVNNYVSGVGMGFYTSAIGIIGFAVFMSLFLAFDPNLMAAINEQIPLHTAKTGFNPITAGAMIIAEGTAITLIGSYIVTRIVDAYFEESSVPTTYHS